MNLLKKTRLYLIGPMEYSEGRSWREKVKYELNPLDLTIFDPYFKPFIDEVKEDEEARKELNEWKKEGKLELISERLKKVRRDDLRLVDISDFFIVYIIPGVASWGSAEEFFWANRLKKPIFVWVEGGRKECPIWVLGTIPPKYIYSSLDEVLKMIKDIDSGKVTIDSERWNLLQEKYR
jgi:hypothetical protein